MRIRGKTREWIHKHVQVKEDLSTKDFFKVCLFITCVCSVEKSKMTFWLVSVMKLGRSRWYLRVKSSKPFRPQSINLNTPPPNNHQKRHHLHTRTSHNQKCKKGQKIQRKEGYHLFCFIRILHSHHITSHRHCHRHSHPHLHPHQPPSNPHSLAQTREEKKKKKGETQIPPTQ